jgi:hypothetical protein
MPRAPKRFGFGATVEAAAGPVKGKLFRLAAMQAQHFLLVAGLVAELADFAD